MLTEMQAVLFDIDDTLFDRRKAQRLILDIITAELDELFRGIDHARITHAFDESDRLTLEDYGAGTTPEDFRERRSATFLRLLRLDESPADRITELYVTRYPTVDAPVDSAREVVERMAGRFRLGVVSNGLQDVQYKKLEAVGIRDRFECIVLSQELGVQKPDRRIFEHAAERLATPADRSAYVGDDFELDVVGAKAAGMRAIWFNPAARRPPHGRVRPDAEIRDLRRLCARLPDL
ncbi:MAG: HAD family hydrolase [Planctomycetota bacterium]